MLPPLGTQQSAPRSWGGPISALLQKGCQGEYVVVGGGGTGKTSLIIDIAADQIAAGVRPVSVLILTGSARASADLRSRLATAVFGKGTVDAIGEPVVRTVHSYAFALLSQFASRHGNPPPRLITAAEQDQIVRDLLDGNVQDGAHRWPQVLRPALSTAGLATSVRDLMARCAERGVDVSRLHALGKRHGRPEWMAVAEFSRQYEEVMLLRSAVGMAAPQATIPALGAAELVGSALAVFAAEPAVLAAERNRIALLLVDDAQHFDPQAARLVRLLAGNDGLSVVTGDPNQAVFGFRGADARLLKSDWTTIELEKSHRFGVSIAGVANAIARRLPGVSLAREVSGSAEDSARVRLAIAGTEGAQASLIADLLRRSHLVDGVPWSQMAVIVRSVPRSGAALRRSLQVLGVPIRTEAAGGSIAEAPPVHALLLAVAAAQGRLMPDEAVTLLNGPIGRVDPVALRRLRRSLLRHEESSGGCRTSSELLRAALLDQDGVPGGVLTDIQAAPVRRVRGVIAAVRDGMERADSPIDVMWAAWSRSGLQRRWDATSRKGGAFGEQADRDLDAMVAFFDEISAYVARTPGIGVTGLIDHMRSLSISVRRDESPAADAVTILSAHAAVGREWEIVAIPDVQEGLWPNTASRGGVLQTQHLIDVLDGIDEPNLSQSSVGLAEERRLFLLAVGRARRRLVISAVDSDGSDAVGSPFMPSRFLTELMDQYPEWIVQDGRTPMGSTRALTTASVIGELRAIVCASAGVVSERRRKSAARHLAKLAAAGFPGAQPESWHGMADISTEQPLWSDPDDPVRLSPSHVQTLIECPLRWLLEQHGGGDTPDTHRALGTLVHSVISEHASDPQAMRRELTRSWVNVMGEKLDSSWFSANELRRHLDLLDNFTAWITATRGELTEAGREVAVDGILTPSDGDLPRVRLVGRIDRLERDAAGRSVVVDIKTGKSAATKDDAQQHAQLAAYQVAVSSGLIEGEPVGDPGGARLVYVAKPNMDDGATQRYQDPLTPQTGQMWQDTIHKAAAGTRGPVFEARINGGCSHCPMRVCCPAHPEGRAVGQQ